MPSIKRVRSPRPVQTFHPALELLEDRTLLSAGMLDPTFGNNGQVLFPFQSGPVILNGATAMALQADGKAVVVGFTTDGGPNRAAIARLNPDGSFDSSFGIGGKEVLDLPPGYTFGQAEAVVFQADGKIVVAGIASPIPYTRAVIDLVRLNPDGTPDSTFGTTGTGQEILDFDYNQADNSSFHYASVANTLAIQPDGKIVVAGSFDDQFLVLRVDANGVPDVTFGQAGLSITGSGEANAIALQPNGDIVIAGSRPNGFIDFSDDPNSGPVKLPLAIGVTTIAVERLHPDGTLDDSFQLNDGLFNGRSAISSASSVAVQADGRIIIVGTSQPYFGTPMITVGRLLDDGSPDPAFGVGGVVSFNFSTVDPGTTGAFGDAVQLRAAGRIVIVGGAIYVPTHHFKLGIAQLLADGAFDSTFGAGGETLIGPEQADAALTAAVLQPDGKLLAAGTVQDFDLSSQVIVVRLDGEGAPLVLQFDPSTDAGDEETTHADTASLDSSSSSGESNANSGQSDHSDEASATSPLTALQNVQVPTGGVPATSSSNLAADLAVIAAGAGTPPNQAPPTTGPASTVPFGSSAAGNDPPRRPRVDTGVPPLPDGGGMGSVTKDDSLTTPSTPIGLPNDAAATVAVALALSQPPVEEAAALSDSALAPSWSPAVLDQFFATERADRPFPLVDTATPVRAALPELATNEMPARWEASLAVALLLLGREGLADRRKQRTDSRRRPVG